MAESGSGLSLYFAQQAISAKEINESCKSKQMRDVKERNVRLQTACDLENNTVNHRA